MSVVYRGMKALALLTIAPFAPGQGVQNGPLPQRIRPAGIPGQPIPEPESTPLIRLNFKGGKVKEFVDAVSQALKASSGKPDAIANVIIRPSAVGAPCL